MKGTRRSYLSRQIPRSVLSATDNSIRRKTAASWSAIELNSPKIWSVEGPPLNPLRLMKAWILLLTSAFPIVWISPPIRLASSLTGFCLSFRRESSAPDDLGCPWKSDDAIPAELAPPKAGFALATFEFEVRIANDDELLPPNLCVMEWSAPAQVGVNDLTILISRLKFWILRLIS